MGRREERRAERREESDRAGRPFCLRVVRQANPQQLRERERGYEEEIEERESSLLLLPLLLLLLLLLLPARCCHALWS